MIKHIWLDSWSDYISGNNDQNYLELEKLNIFIGRNNTGKSRLLRLLYASNINNISYALSTDDALNQNLSNLNEFSSCIPKGGVINGINGDHLKSIVKRNVLILNNVERGLLNKLKNEVVRIEQGNRTQSNNVNIHKIVRDANTYKTQNKKSIFSDIDLKQYAENRIYIPILRGMRPISGLEQEPYKTRTHNDYFQNIPHADQSIHTGENLYNLLKEHLLGLPEQREKIKTYEELLSNIFFEGEPVTLIPKHDNDVVNVKISNEHQRPIHELGDGLQHIIIITSIAYLTEAQSLIILEEPENCLHPGLLRQLINFLINDTIHQYCITTHSNHMLEFADERKDALVHKVTKTTNGGKLSFNIATVSKDRDLLIDLGVKSSSLYLANCTIWIEGITDRLYLKVFINKYLSHLKETDTNKNQKYNKYLENYHYSFVEYQGGNLSHWTFNEDIEDDTINEICALSVNSNVFLIADGDISTKKNRADKFKKQLGENFYLLPCKEIENLIPATIIQSVTKKMFPKFKRDTYGKIINDIAKLKYNDYKMSPEGIGYHIDKALGLSGKGAKSNTRLIFADNSGTIKDKMKFCRLATKHMEDLNSWQITDEIIDICQSIFLHIEKYNDI